MQPSGGILGTIPIGYYEAPSRTGSYYLPVGEDRFPETIRRRSSSHSVSWTSPSFPVSPDQKAPSIAWQHHRHDD